MFGVLYWCACLVTAYIQVIATDPDPGPIGEVHYRIITEFDAAGSFAVDRASGNISVKSRLDFDTRYVCMYWLLTLPQYVR